MIFYDSNSSHPGANVSSIVLISLQKQVGELKTKNSKIPASLKLQILDATSDMSCGKVAELFRLNKSTVSRWRNGVAKSCRIEREIENSKSSANIATVAESNLEVALPLQRFLATLFTALLVIASTLLLVAEARLFYEQDSNSSLALIKAVILEGSVIYLSFLKINSLAEKFAKTIMLSILITYSAYTVSGQLLTNSDQNRSMERSLSTEIDLLSRELVVKDQKIQTYLGLERVSLATKLERERSELLARLSKLQDQQRSVRTMTVGKGSLYSLIIFRFILLIMNVFLTHRLRNLSFAGPQLSRSFAARPLTHQFSSS